MSSPPALPALPRFGAAGAREAIASPARRHALQAAALALVGPPAAQATDSMAGRVRPAQRAPALSLTTHAGQRVALPQLLGGAYTAVQLMFTGCSSVCPIQGAQFAQLQAHLGQARRPHRLLSISIDPLGDGASQLAQWLRRWQAEPGRWAAAVPQPAGVPALLAGLRGLGTAPDVHTAQVFVFNPRAELIYRTEPLPEARPLIQLLDEAAAASA